MTARLLCKSVRNDSQWQPVTVWNDSVARAVAPAHGRAEKVAMAYAYTMAHHHSPLSFVVTIEILHVNENGEGH
jgi:hypothetical protein